MDNNMMMQFMQMVMQNQTMMNQMMMQLMAQPNPNPVQAAAPSMPSIPSIPSASEVIVQSNAAVTTSVQEINDLKAEIEKLKSELAAAQSELTSTKSELYQTQTALKESQAKVNELNTKTTALSDTGKKMEQVPEGQLTLEDEIKYQERHGKEGHENYKKIMEQLSEEDRKKVREMYYADSDGVFYLSDLAEKKGTTAKDIFYLLHPEMKDKPGLVEFKDEVNELGF